MRYRLLFVCLFFVLPLSAITFSDIAKAENQLADSVNRTLTLIFCIDQAHYAISPDSIEAVYAWGSMSDYHDAVPACLMTDFSEDSCYYKTYTYDEIARPGDSGQPEFEFYVQLRGDSTVYYTPDMMNTVTYDERLLFINSVTPVLILLPGGPEYMTTDRVELGLRGEQAREVRPLIDYDLSDSVDQHHISNFRRVTGTQHLYRSYHPYYPSNVRWDTEVERLNWVAELAEDAGIRSAISLTGDLSYAVGETYVCHGDTYTVAIPTYYQQLTDSGNITYVSASASGCYYYTDGMSFALNMKQVVEFIADEQHPLPMQIHCAIGADRTGVVCAVLSLLCGADWEDVLADYAETGQMRCRVYRHPNRIRYAISRLTGLNPDHVPVQQVVAAIRHHLVETCGVLTHDQIDQMVIRLTSGIPSFIEQNRPHTTTPNRYYDMSGRPTDGTSHGLKLSAGTKKLLLHFR